MGFDASTSASRDRTSSDTFQNTNSNRNSNRTTNTTGTNNQTSILDMFKNMFQSDQRNQTGSTSATFDHPAASGILNSLSGSGSTGTANTNKAADIYNSFSSGGVNPYTEGVISAGNAEADKNFAGRLAQTRAGAYRGGTAANIGKQGQLAADFSAEQAGNNAKLRQGAFESGQTLKLGAANGLGSLGNQQQGLASNLLSLLRGSSSTGSSVGTTSGGETSNQVGNNQSQNTQQTVENFLEQLIASLTSQESGTKSTTAGKAGLSFGKTG